MNRIFADACYWIALLNRNDQLHDAAEQAQKKLVQAQVITTDEVLGEVLNFFCRRGPRLRSLAAEIIEDIRTDSKVLVFEQSRATFDSGLTLYKSRIDKEYSMVDCVSFLLMKQEGITEALTDDHHFGQESFIMLLREVSP